MASPVSHPGPLQPACRSHGGKTWPQLSGFTKLRIDNLSRKHLSSVTWWRWRCCGTSAAGCASSTHRCLQRCWIAARASSSPYRHRFDRRLLVLSTL